MMEKSNIAAVLRLFDNPNMPDEAGISHYAALEAIKPEALTFNAWANKAGLNRSIFANIRSHNNPTSETLQKLLDVIGASLSDYEAARDGAAPVLSEVAPARTSDLRRDWNGPRRDAPDVPLLGSAIGGEYAEIAEHVELTELDTGEPIEWLARPPALARDLSAYAVTVLGDSMSPAFEPGTKVLVSPMASVGMGHNVVVQLNGERDCDDRVRMVLIKRFIRRTPAGIELRQFNPDVTFLVPVHRICTDAKGRAAIHKVIQALF